ncbi:META domain-containing protein [Psychrobacter sp. B38]|uniref:META domain-containing protein n=1 Tax=Psychrobacter sp. B38 TaxID=3143538 RepID=UPI0032108129
MKTMTKTMGVAILAVGTLAAGCQSMPSITSLVAKPVTVNALQAYNWQLVDAKRTNGDKVDQLFINPAKPLTLNFSKDNGNNRVRFMNTCNNMSAEYTVMNGTVQIKNGISTLMACPEPQASFDKATLETVQGKYSLNNNVNNMPILTIRNDNQVAYFKAVAR